MVHSHVSSRLQRFEFEKAIKAPLSEKGEPFSTPFNDTSSYLPLKLFHSRFLPQEQLNIKAASLVTIS